MDELQKAIEKIMYADRKFPREALGLINENRDAAIPYLRDAVEKAIQEKEELDENYLLHLYGIFLLAQFQDREFFPKIVELACLPEETLDYLIGDVLTEDLGNILYNTYNGDLDLLKRTVMIREVSDFARAQMLYMMGQLYQDQTLEKQILQEFLKEIVYREERIGDYIYTVVARMIYRCHLTDLIPELRRLYADGLIDEAAIGGYDMCVDSLFQYKDPEKPFCTPVDTVKSMQNWPMYDDIYMDGGKEKNLLGSQLNNIVKQLGSKAASTEQRKVVKVGRNDPCPCGSGRKYKQCCLRQNENLAEGEESRQEQARKLSSYPRMDAQRKEGRVYLEDIYSSESIELDKLLYLALKRCGGWKTDEDTEETAAKRKRKYLTDAYRRFQEIVARENIESFAEYDDRYSIHYLCAEWFGELTELLEKEDMDGLLEDVRQTCGKMGTK